MKTTQFTRLAFLASVSLVVLGSTSGCTPGTPAPSATPTAIAATPVAPATPTPTPTPTTIPFAIDCDTIVSPATRASITSPLFPPADFFAKNASEVSSSQYLVMRDNGGTVCAFGGNEVGVVYGYSPLAASQVAEVDSLILGADPYTTSTYAGGTLYTSGMDGNPFTFFLITDTGLYLATTMAILDDLLATVPTR